MAPPPPHPQNTLWIYANPKIKCRRGSHAHQWLYASDYHPRIVDGIVFSIVCLSLSVCLSVNTITRESLKISSWNIQAWASSYGRKGGQVRQESPADARVARDSAVIPRWPSAAILDFIEPQIAPFDPPTPKTLALEPKMEWIGCTFCEIFAFRPKLYCDLETGVRGKSMSLKTAPCYRAHTTLYASSIVTMPLSFTVSESRVFVKNCYPLVFGAPVGGEAVRFTHRPLVTKN